MNRRDFVSRLGASTLSANWLLRDGRDLASEGAAASTAGAAIPRGPSSAIWQRPVLVPLPAALPGVSRAIVSLHGTWKVNTTPPAEYWTNAVDPAGWTDITVPGELTGQGIEFARDNEFAYKRAVPIPAEAAGKALLLRFDGVYSYARVWVNGHFIREHHGGFTSWDCDITQHVTPGQPAWITVGVTDRADDISYASNYAKHFIGGILRSVKLVLVPPTHLSRLHAETDFDSSFRDARLTILAAAVTGERGDVKLNLRLTDPEGKGVSINPSSLDFSADRPEGAVDIPVTSPVKWDAEHPNLYTLDAELLVHNSVVEELQKRIGFRKVERRKNRLYVNGQPVKLHGVCRHDTNPTWGRVTSPEQDERDALLLRDANVNFVRTSHYPPSENFLDACDRHGIYVEEETAVCFVRQRFSVMGGGTESDPNFTSRYMNQFAEMIERDRSHACVIFWSLGNESAWGTNFQKEHDYAKREDPTRPVIFSYPRTVPAGVDGYDLFSHHYPAVDGDLTSKDIPKLNDEYAHISCYNTETLKRDPGIRNYWGHSIKRFWENCHASDGCLGGAIWAGFDEVFMLPGSPVGYGEWGIIDGWRRPKPEYWLTRKAYSPVRIPDQDIPDVPGAGSPLPIPVKNWFNHTNLSELRILWSVGSDSGEITGLNLAPGGDGVITVPGRAWRNGEVVNLKFICSRRILVDEFNLRIGNRSVQFPAEKGPAPKVAEDTHSLTVQGADFALVFDKTTGLIKEGTFRGKHVIESGPVVTLGAAELPPWWLTSLSYRSTSEAVVISLSGAYMARRGGGQVLGAEFEIRVDGQGLITTNYTLRGEPKGMSEVGIAFTLTPATDRLSWDRKGLWSVYPDDHIGRAQGVAARESNIPAEVYARVPEGPWSQDTKDFFLFGREDQGGRGTNDFRSLKENIWRASCILQGTDLRLRAESDGTAAVRTEVLPDGKVKFCVDNLWAYPDLVWGNYCPPITLDRGYKNSVRVRLTDTDEA